MARTKRLLAGAVGAGIGLVTLRRVRRRRDPGEEAREAAEEALTEASKAIEHSAASLEHAREAGEKSVEVASEQLEEVRGSIGQQETTKRPLRDRVLRRRG